MTTTELVDGRAGTRTWVSKLPGWCPSLRSSFPSGFSQEGMATDVQKAEEWGNEERKKEIIQEYIADSMLKADVK